MLELQFEPGTACGLLTRSDSSTGVLTLNLLSELSPRVDGQLHCPLPFFQIFASPVMSTQETLMPTLLPFPCLSLAHQGNPIH